MHPMKTRRSVYLTISQAVYLISKFFLYAVASRGLKWRKMLQMQPVLHFQNFSYALFFFWLSCQKLAILKPYIFLFWPLFLYWMWKSVYIIYHLLYFIESKYHCNYFVLFVYNKQTVSCVQGIVSQWLALSPPTSRVQSWYLASRLCVWSLHVPWIDSYFSVYNAAGVKIAFKPLDISLEVWHQYV